MALSIADQIALDDALEILIFLASLGHSGDIRKLTDVNVNKLHQPWRSFAAVINKYKNDDNETTHDIRYDVHDDDENAQEDDDEHDDDKKADDDDDEELTESDEDGDDFVHPKLTTHDDEIIHEEDTDEDDSSISSSDEEDSDNDVEGANVASAKSDEDSYILKRIKGNDELKDTNTDLD
ncbi:hypothetical protein Tco_0332725 [Tanacetum coccineum]